MLTTPEVVRSAAARSGEALVDGGRRWSFSELAAEVSTAARAFMAHGVRPGDRVAVWAPNSAEWILAALGAQAAGGIVVPLNTRFKGPEAAYVIDKSGADVLVCSRDFLGVDHVAALESTGARLPSTVITISTSPDRAHLAWNDFVSTASRIDPDEQTSRADAVSPTDPCDIIFTSGTTGRPKGVVSEHGQTVRVFQVWSDVVGLAAGDRYLIVNPFFHTFGYKAGFLACLLRGATIVPEAVFDVPRVLARVAAERITALPGPPTLYLSILDHPRRTEFDLSSLRLAVTGAAAVPVEMIRRMRTELSFTTILTAYGLTESTGVVTMCRPDDDPETISRTSGRAIPDVEVRVVDDDGHEVPRGDAGEIVCRGYNVMPGYYLDPEATAATIDADGWLHTGDVGVMDENGCLTITDRKKDMFIVGGFNAYPAEIENALLEHPAVANAAVIGVPDDRLGEVGHAFVVARHGANVAPDELIEWARPRMANFKVPRRVTVVDALPTNASGKVQKFELRRWVTDAGESPPHQPSRPI